MKEFFDAYKKYIIKHPTITEYKPTNLDKYNAEKLHDAYKKLNTTIACTKEDALAIKHFVLFSNYMHDSYTEFYNLIKNNYLHLNLIGRDIAEYIVAELNREYKVIWNKRQMILKNAEKGPYFLSDIMNFKLQSPIGLVDARACLESATDSINLLLNYLRHCLDQKFTTTDFAPEEFADNIYKSMQFSQMIVVLKYSYDDILYNGGFVNIDNTNKLITFDYEDHNKLKLRLAGDMMFTEHRLQAMRNAEKKGIIPRLFKHITNYRIKKVKINNSCINLDFGQGEPKEHKQIVCDMQSAIDSYYEFLVGDTVLPHLANCTIDEAISVWCAIQYVARYVSSNCNYDVPLKTREDYSPVPSKILKSDLISYIIKLTDIKPAKIRAITSALEADWNKFNDIWSSMLYPIGDYYLLPFYPIIHSSPYNVIDQILLRGGFNLDERGKQFETYIYNKLTQNPSSYPIICMPTGKYGIQGNEEEIDVLISMKNAILVADAKCIHYSVEPNNYAEAWKRLEEGCEQVIRKVNFIKNNTQYFCELKDISSKAFISFVVTNYPTFTGFSHKGVYIIDSHSFLAYIQRGVITMRELALNTDSILDIKAFYHNEDQFSNEFSRYLSDNPIKHEFLKRIYIHDLPLVPENNGWRIISKSAQIRNDPRLNIHWR